MPKKLPVRVFISYRYEEKTHNTWVVKLYEDLRAEGVDALIDQFEVAPGESFSEYMTKGIRDSRHVIFIITPGAVKKVESESSGALGFEIQIANARRIAAKKNFSIIGILRKGDDLPTILSDNRYIDFRDDSAYEENLEILLKWLHDEIKPPPLGRRRSDKAEPQIEIHIRKHYRTRFQFSLVSRGLSHWAVNRLYLKYLNEFEWDIGPSITEAQMFETNYSIWLSKEYSEYDIIPLTPDQEISGFEYRGSDSDHFAVELFGTDVSQIRVCAEIYDFNNREQSLIESQGIRIVGSSTRKPNWNAPLKVESRRLIEHLRPLAYKVFLHLNFDDFLRKLTKYQIKMIDSDLRNLMNLDRNRLLSDKNQRTEYNDFVRLKSLYDSNKLALQEEEMKRLAELMQNMIAGKGFASGNAFISHIERILKEIHLINQEWSSDAPNKDSSANAKGRAVD